MSNKRGFNYQNSGDALMEYLQELEKPEYDVLDKAEEVALMKEYLENGNIDAKKALINHNVRLVPFIIKQCGIYSPDLMDLIQAGNIGLIEAVENFNPSANCRLGTYASFLIKKHILGTLSSDNNKVYIPYGMSNKVDRYRHMKERANRENYELSDEVVMEELKIGKTTLKTLKQAVAIEYASLSAPIGVDGDEKIYVADLLQDDSIETFERELVAEENHNILLTALGRLNPREYDIVTSTYGLGCEKKSSRTLADKYSISMERVCQIRKAACKKMKMIFNENGVFGTN